jgi:hypothetical protein
MGVLKGQIVMGWGASVKVREMNDYKRNGNEVGPCEIIQLCYWVHAKVRSLPPLPLPPQAHRGWGTGAGWLQYCWDKPQLLWAALDFVEGTGSTLSS